MIPVVNILPALRKTTKSVYRFPLAMHISKGYKETTYAYFFRKGDYPIDTNHVDNVKNPKWFIPIGCPIVSPMDGVVSKASKNDVAIYTPDLIIPGMQWVGEISNVSHNLKKGQKVYKGDLIGKATSAPVISFYTWEPKTKKKTYINFEREKPRGSVSKYTYTFGHTIPTSHKPKPPKISYKQTSDDSILAGLLATGLLLGLVAFNKK